MTKPQAGMDGFLPRILVDDSVTVGHDQGFWETSGIGKIKLLNEKIDPTYISLKEHNALIAAKEAELVELSGALERITNIAVCPLPTCDYEANLTLARNVASAALAKSAKPEGEGK